MYTPQHLTEAQADAVLQLADEIKASSRSAALDGVCAIAQVNGILLYSDPVTWPDLVEPSDMFYCLRHSAKFFRALGV